MSSEVSRRAFLHGAGAVVAGVAVTPRASAVAQERTRAVVIGSGFGGAVAALRLAEAGVSTVVLERGRRWTIKGSTTFPTFWKPDRRSSWFTTRPVYPMQPPTLYRPYAGLFEKIYGHGTNVICGAGVGGSSLVYGGVIMRPDEELFTRVMPGSIDYAEMVREYYPRVLRMMRFAPVPEEVLEHPRYRSSRLFLEHAKRAGLPHERSLVDCDWEVVKAELRGDIPAAASIGEYLTGLNSGARNSVDRSYLKSAEATGLVRVLPLHVVTGIRADAAGRYVVSVNQINDDGIVLARKVFTTDALFLGAGSMGTSKLLVRAKGRGWLPGLNEHVGRHWGTNGDRVYIRIGIPEATGAHQGGPMCAIIPGWHNPNGPATIEHGPGPYPIETRSMAVPGVSVVPPDGWFEYSARTDRAELHWPVASDTDAQQAMRATLQRLVSATGGPPDAFAAVPRAVLDAFAKAFAGTTPAAFAALVSSAGMGVIDLGAIEPLTFHPLGGVVIDKACDTHGRVLGHPGLYVVDASLVPGSTGAANPAWTIAALAERCMDRILRDDLGVQF